MALEKIPLEAYKTHQGEGDQVAYKGRALNSKEQAIAEKVNEIIEYINSIASSFGLGAELLGVDNIKAKFGFTAKVEKCCQDEEVDKDLGN